MFTIKLYTNNGARLRIHEADDFTILRDQTGDHFSSWAEITAHRKSGDDIRFDVGPSPCAPSGGTWEKAIIENAAGRTSEIIGYDVPPHSAHAPPPQ